MRDEISKIKNIYYKGGVKSVFWSLVRFGSYQFLSNKQRHYIYTKLRYNKNKILYDNVAEPFKIIYVKPDSIKYRNEQRVFPLDRGIGYIKGGKWDKNYTDFSDLRLYNALYRHFKQDVPWTETAIIDLAEEAVSKGDSWAGRDSVEEVINHRCEKIENLYKTIKQEGYKTQDEVKKTVDENQNPPEDYIPLEIMVTIGRNGELLFYSGHHRLSIAKILNIDQIPVMVLARHLDWQKKREEFNRCINSNEFFSSKIHNQTHPDLFDLI